MNDKRHKNGSHAGPQSDNVETAYAEFLECFYDRDDRTMAIGLAAHLEQLLAASPQYSGSIREQEIRSLIAEARGELDEAARYREAEIRKILELHSISANTASWPSVAKHYDFSDVSDRLDLLAIIYDGLGQTDSAINVLHESKQYCESHDLDFDAQNILDELEGRRRGTAALRGPHAKRLFKRGGKDYLSATHKRMKRRGKAHAATTV